MLDKSFNPKEAEPRLYKAWEDSGAFQPKMDTALEPYSIVIPPPNVTGSLHMGHALNDTLQDILIRFERMRGKDVLWQPGTDHAGIATQMVVERKMAEAGQRGRKDMSREEFEAKVWEWKEESGGTITQQLRRLGASCDWSREKFTLGTGEPDDQMVQAVTKVFVELYDEGLIYRDKRLVNWDPHFQTAISDLEVENREVDGHFWHFKYPLALKENGERETYTYVEKDEDGNVTLREIRDYISIATTRPETMLGDGAVAVHPDDERYKPIVGKMVRLPLANRLIPIITDDYPDPDLGSGAVKITGAHDFNDYEVAKRNNIPMYSLMDERAAMCESEIMPEKYVGMDRFVARKAVVADIDAEGLLIKVEDKKVMQPFGDRSGAVIEPMLTDQWFVDAEKLAVEAIAAVDRGHSTSPLPEGEGARRAGEGQDNKSAQSAASDNAAPHPSLRDTFSPGEKGKNPQSRGLTATPVPGLEPGSPATSREAEGGPGSSPGTQECGKGSTRFIPENWKKTYDNWMDNIQPWCISRQLWWGHRIPAWYGPRKDLVQNFNIPELDNDSVFVAFDKDQALKIAQTYYDTHNGKGAVKVVFLDNPTEIMNYDSSNPQNKNFSVKAAHKDIDGNITAFIYRDPDVLDTWFSSGLWPFSTLGWPEPTPELARFYPGSVLVTAFDIIFFWVARMMMQGLHFMGEVPFKDVYIHALVLDEKGQKMSKSKGNVVDPLELIDTYGADALRFTMAAMAAQGRNVRLSTQRIEGYRNFGTKLWNAARFGEMNGCQSDPGFDPKSCTQSVNQWIVSEAVIAARDVTKFIEDYRFDAAADAAYKFAWGTYCDWYLELIKPIMAGDDASAKSETQAAAAWALDQILKLLHPFMPFITEELWANTAEARDTDLILAEWPVLGDDLINAQAADDINWLIRLVTALRSVRSEMNVPPSKKAPLLMLADNADPRLTIFAEALERMARVEAIETASAAPQGALQCVVDGATYAIPMEGLIDLDAEKARLTKEIKKTQSEIDKIDKKLGNEAFISKAPEKVVTLQKDRRAAYVEELVKLGEALAVLG